MEKFLQQFGDSLVSLNQTLPGHVTNRHQFQPGIGPYTEELMVKMGVEFLSKKGLLQESYYLEPDKATRSQLGLQGYAGPAGQRATPDLVLGNRIIEFKLARPLGDNGQLEDTWFKKCFDPHPNSYSTFIDVEKLSLFHSNHDQQNQFEKWVVVIGFERQQEIEYPLDRIFPRLFLYISNEIAGRQVIEQAAYTCELGDRHPVHQVLKLYAFRYGG